MPTAVHCQPLHPHCLEAVRLTGALASSIWLWDVEREALQMACSHGLDEEYVAYGNQVSTTDVAKERAPVYRSFRGEIVELDAPAKDPRFAFFNPEFADRGFEAVVSLPLQLDDEPQGALALYFEHRLDTHRARTLEVELLATRAAASAAVRACRAQLDRRTSELEQLNQVLVRQVEHLDGVSRKKTELLGVLSHELRTPLTAIIGYSDILLQRAKSDPDGTTTEFLGYIRASAKRLQAMTEDGMAASLIENGMLSLAPERCDMVELVRGAIASFNPRLLAKQIALQASGLDAPVPMVGDVRRLHQALANVLGNATKFAPATSRIALALAATPEQVSVCIGDHGPGIPADELVHVFDKFYQADASSGQRHGGVGLGLMITRSIMQAHGGTVTIESQVGEGTQVTLALPREQATSGQFSYEPEG